MRVFALGGYGKVGFPAVKLLAQSDLITGIAIAGRSLGSAEKAAAAIGEKAVAVQADGTDEQKLIPQLVDYDIVMNAATDESVLPAIRAAMGTGTHYCDANVFVIEQALQLASEAKVAGITSVLANGIHPSISNLMGVHVAHQLEEVEQLQLGDASIYHFASGQELTPGQWLVEPQQSLTALKKFKPSLAWMLQMAKEKGSRTACSHHDGRWMEIDPVRNGVDVPMTQGGTATAYPYAGSEPLFGSLPGDLATTSPVEMFFSALPPQLHEVLRELALRVLEGDFDSDTATNSLYDTVERDPRRWLTLPDDFTPFSKLWARAVGRKEGRAARCSCWFTAPMWNVGGGYFLTSVALAVAVRKVLRGEIQERGVMTAETTFEPLPFLDEVASLLPDLPPDRKMIDESFEWLE